MHSVITSVSIAPGQFENARQSLKDEVVPRASKAPGFVKGYWTISGDAAQGLSMVVFKTSQDAQNAVNMIRGGSMPPGVTLKSVEIQEVVADA